MSKFKVGQKVRIRNDERDEENQSMLSDIESDLLCDISEGDITGRQYDAIRDIIEKHRPVTIAAVEEQDDGEGYYELKHGRLALPGMYPESLLEEMK